MISALAGLMLQAIAAVPGPPAPPAPPPPPPPGRTKPARAKANLASLFSDDDYPAEAMRNHEAGTVGFRLQVGTDGLVTSCAVTQSSASVSLDSATCRLLTARARFTPAHNRRGRPITDSVVGRITWRLGESRLPRLEASLLVVTMGATSAGEIICSVAINGVPQADVHCPNDLDPEMIARARVSGRNADQTVVTSITPSGDRELADAGDHGAELLAMEALLDIAPDGSVLECRVVQNEVRGPAAGRASPQDPCRPFRPGSRAFEIVSRAGPGAGADGPRKVTIKTRIYYRF